MTQDGFSIIDVDHDVNDSDDRCTPPARHAVRSYQGDDAFILPCSQGPCGPTLATESEDRSGALGDHQRRDDRSRHALTHSSAQ